MTYGPMDLVVLVFGQAMLSLEFGNHWRWPRDDGIVRLVDAVVVWKDGHSDPNETGVTDVSAFEDVQLGTLAGALSGYGGAGEEAPRSARNSEGWLPKAAGLVWTGATSTS